VLTASFSYQLKRIEGQKTEEEKAVQPGEDETLFAAFLPAENLFLAFLKLRLFSN